MRKMNKVLHHSKIFVKRNASTILTCAGGVGVIATSVLAVKATPKAMLLLNNAKEEKGEELTKMEVVKVAGPAYIPAAVTGIATITCIFGANILNKRQQASLASAYALLDNSYKEYKKKVTELYGEEANTRIKEELAKDKYEPTTVAEGKQLFYDEFSGRYFEATLADVLRAEYDINRKLSDHSGAYLNEFYEMLDIPPVDFGDYIGWSAAEVYDMYWHSWIDFQHQKVVMEDGLECTIISMVIEPTYGFEDY